MQIEFRHGVNSAGHSERSEEPRNPTPMITCEVPRLRSG